VPDHAFAELVAESGERGGEGRGHDVSGAKGVGA
jgi:hypothetical protein